MAAEVQREGGEEELEAKMPLLDHLVELRRRLIISMVAFLAAFVVCFYFANPLFNFLVEPLAQMWEDQEGRRLIFTALHEKFFTNVKIAFFVAAMAAFPVIAMQVWLFVAPGLYKRERLAFLPFLVVTPVLFLIGGAAVYYGLMPIAWRFFAGFQQLGAAEGLPIELLPKVSEYLGLSMRLIFAFGLAFELPVAMTLLARAGLATSDGMKKKRKYAVVLAFVAAAILTPPDPLSQLALAFPIILLYEISIWSARLVERRRDREARAAEAA